MTQHKIEQRDMVVVGAGFSGLYMVYRAREVLGLDVVAFEAGGGVGGTWYWNRYPGAKCDTQAIFYSYSFSPELDQDWVWTRKYPGQAELLSYLEHVAERFDLRRSIVLDTTVESAHFDEEAERWIVRTNRGQEVSAKYFVTAAGCLSAVTLPDYPGLETFTGRCYHAARWPQEGVDMRGKRVAILGTGSTGIQAAPVIAQDAAELYVLQRTPNWSVPAQDADLTAEELADIKAQYPQIREQCRQTPNGMPFNLPNRSAFEVTPEERQEIFEAAWQAGGFQFLIQSFGDVLTNTEANKMACDFLRDKIRSFVDDPAVADALCPDYPYAAKRPPFDTDYYKMFNRPNVTLVDLTKEPIQEFTPDGIRTTDRDIDFDTIILATGYDALTGALIQMDIRGRDGVTLETKWHDGVRTYLGLQTTGFPNMFVIVGPQSPSVLGTVPGAAEQQIEWISDCIDHLQTLGATTVEPTDSAEQQWVEEVREVGAAVVMSLGANQRSWYVGANVDGKKQEMLPYAGGQGHYGELIAEVAKNGYQGFQFRMPSDT